MSSVAMSTELDGEAKKHEINRTPTYTRCPQTDLCCPTRVQMIRPETTTKVHPKHVVEAGGCLPALDSSVVDISGHETTTCDDCGATNDEKKNGCVASVGVDGGKSGKTCSCGTVFQAFRKGRVAQKLVFVFSIATIIFLASTCVHEPWLVLYFYTVIHPILMVVRLYMYWKQKWQFYLLDLCYFVNWAMYIYIWACPAVEEYFMVVYSFCTGPVVLAVILFRNSLVLHSTDKMTSCALHVMPLLVAVIVRWYPHEVSEYWYTPFVHFHTDDFAHLAVWLWAVPFAFYIFHMILYLFLVKVVFRPSDEYDYSFKYLAGLSNTSGAGCFTKCIGIFGPKHKQLTYCLWTVVYGLVGFSFTPVLFLLIYANYIYVAIVVLIVSYNGASYYVEVFGPKNFT